MLKQAPSVPLPWLARFVVFGAAALMSALPAAAQNVSAPLTITTFAGAPGQAEATNGTGAAARFYNPTGIALDSSGNLIVADASNNIFRKVTSGAVVTTFSGMPVDPENRPTNSGSADGGPTAASYHIGEYTPPPVFGCVTMGIDSSGTIYIADTLSNTVRKISSSGSVVTLAGAANQQGSANGTGGDARFLVPAGVAIDSSGNIYVADSGNDMIRKVTPGGVVTTFAGAPRAFGSADGTGAAARFVNPTGIAIDSSGNLYVTDSGNHTIRKISPGAVVTTFAGYAGISGTADGSGQQARFNSPSGIAIDANNNLYVVDTGNNTIRKITPAGTVATIAGSPGVAGHNDGTGTGATFDQPYGIAVDPAGSTIYITDSGNDTIRRGTFASGSGSLQVTGVPPALVQANTGANVTLKISASGSPAPTYQWSKDGNPISGATGPALTLTSVSSSSAGNYTVTVTSGALTYTTSPSRLQVFAPPTVVPSVTIVMQPTDRAINVGQSTTFTVEATSSQPLTYQWSKNGTPITGATNASYTINSATVNDAGAYAVVVTDGSSTATTNGVSLSVTGTTPLVSPTFTQQPSSLTGSVGGSVTFTANASGTPPPTYRWQKNGVTLSNGTTISGADTASLTLSNLGPNDAGSYSVVATNSAGTATSNAATLTVNSAPPPPPPPPPSGPTAWLVNLSVRTTMVAGQDPLIVGVTTNDSKDILVRAVGPGLATYGVTGVLADPSVQLYPLGSSTAVASNNDWNASLAPLFPSVGAFGLTAGSKDAALVQSIKGPYSAWELPTGAGTVLVEAYDTNPNTPATRLTNVSARNRVGTGGDVLIAGFAVQGTGSKKLLIRAIGPKLADYGVSGTLADPQLEIYQGSTLVASNDNWDPSLASTFASVGAFALPAGSKDAALIVELAAGTPPQTYTALVKGANGSTGVALVEVYEVP